MEAIAYLEQFPVAVYAHTDKGTFRAEGWEKTGLSEKYPYIRFSEGNVKDLGAFLRTSGVKVMKMGAFVLKDGLAQELLEKEALYRVSYFAHRRWDHRIKLCGCLKGKCTVYTL